MAWCGHLFQPDNIEGVFFFSTGCCLEKPTKPLVTSRIRGERVYCFCLIKKSRHVQDGSWDGERQRERRGMYTCWRLLRTSGTSVRDDKRDVKGYASRSYCTSWAWHEREPLRVDDTPTVIWQRREWPKKTKDVEPIADSVSISHPGTGSRLASIRVTSGRLWQASGRAEMHQKMEGSRLRWRRLLLLLLLMSKVSHDVDEVLARISHGHAKRLARSRHVVGHLVNRPGALRRWCSSYSGSSYPLHCTHRHRVGRYLRIPVAAS